MRSKYGAKKVVVDGITFDSKAEARRYQDLKLMELAGEIVNLYVHKPFEIWVLSTKVCTYDADFVYFDNRRNQLVVEDVKGMRSGPAWTLFRLKAKLIQAIYGYEVEVYPPAVKKPRRKRARTTQA